MVTGTWISAILRSIASRAVFNDSPSGRLKAMAVETEVPVWLTLTGVVPVVKWLNAENGTTVSLAVLTAAPVEVLPRPALAREFAARLRAASWAVAAALEDLLDAAVLSTVVPATACVAWVPLTAPPEVLTYSSLSISGFCQNSGATSMTTWYCCGLNGL